MKGRIASSVLPDPARARTILRIAWPVMAAMLTQTFINQMLDPACVTVWLDIPTYKIKQIARLLHPLDPNLTDYERNVVRYINLIHRFFHGEYPRDCIAVVYYNVEVYDSSPGTMEGRGTRISP